MNRDPSADSLREFYQVVQSGSITAAAKKLKIPRPTLSRHIAELEQQLGVRLLQRTTRQMHLTAAGQELYMWASRVVADVDAAWGAVRRHDGVPRGPLRVAVPGSQLAASPFFVDFALEFPNVELDVVAVHGDVDIRAMGFDVALQFGEVKDPTLITRKLWSMHQCLLASREYIETWGKPRSVRELSEHRCIMLRSEAAVGRSYWPLLEGGQIEVSPAMLTNSFGLLVGSVRRGVGLGLLPVQGFQSEVDAGTLVPVLDDVIGEDDALRLVFVERDFMLPHMRQFIDRASEFWRDWMMGWSAG